jgi:hypothetical protein
LALRARLPTSGSAARTQIGNLQHILPILYAAAHEGVGVSTATTMQGSSGSASQEGHAQQAHMTIDEL